MKKIILISIIVTVFIVGFGTGMITEKILDTSSTTPNGSNSNNVNKEFFIGTWTAYETSQNESAPGAVYYTFAFYENDTIHIIMDSENATQDIKTIVDTWEPYTLIDETILHIRVPSGAILDYEYEFSSNKQELTLIREGTPLTFSKS